MYIDKDTDKCDECGTVMQAGNFVHGHEGSDPKYLNKDICFECADKLDIGNCSDCATVHKNSTLDKAEYRCYRCVAKWVKS